MLSFYPPNSFFYCLLLTTYCLLLVSTPFLICLPPPPLLFELVFNRLPPYIRWKRRDFLHPKLIIDRSRGKVQKWSNSVIRHLKDTDSLVPGLGDVNSVLLVNDDVLGRYQKAGLPPPRAKLV